MGSKTLLLPVTYFPSNSFDCYILSNESSITVTYFPTNLVHPFTLNYLLEKLYPRLFDIIFSSLWAIIV